MPKVSIVIPVYKVEKYLRDCLDSALGQTLRDVEVICIDDASPDGCGAILDEYAARNPKVRVVHLPENRRQGYGRNRGMDMARGEYIYFLDSDDMIAPEAMEELADLSEKEGLDGVFFDSRVIFDSENLARRYASYPAGRRGEYPESAVDGQTLFSAFIRQREWTCYVQRQFWRLDFLRREGVRFPDGVEHEDELFAFEGILAAGRIRYLRRDYFIRRYREESVMTTPPTAKNFHGYFMNFVFMEEFLHSRGIRLREADENVARIYERMVRYYRELSGKCDIAAYFRPEELPLLRFFEASQKSDVYYEYMRPGLEETLRAYKRIYIYGAGAIGGIAYRTLVLHNLAVEGFLVTRREGNPGVFCGRPVYTAAEREVERDGIVLVAMTRGYAQEVSDFLRSSGWSFVSFEE